MVGACVCLCLRITKFSPSSPAASGHDIVAEVVVFYSQIFQLHRLLSVFSACLNK